MLDEYGRNVLNWTQNKTQLAFNFYFLRNSNFPLEYTIITQHFHSVIVQIRIEYSISTGRLDVNDYKNQLYIVFYVEKITAYTYTDE